jgi:putative phosphoribosyl transferase
LRSGPHTLFIDRTHAGRELAAVVAARYGGEAFVIVGLARGGVAVAAEVARVLDQPLDAVAVRKVGHPLQPEYALGATTPGGGLYLHDSGGLRDAGLAAAIRAAQEEASALDDRLHAGRRSIALTDRPCLLVDDGLATGATMMAAVRWARSAGASRVVVAVPVAASDSLGAIRREADDVVCPHALHDLVAVGLWYRRFDPVSETEVGHHLDAAAARTATEP